MKSRYLALAKYLSRMESYEVTLSFKEIEKILGFPLPESARQLRSWWANDLTHPQCLFGWAAAGYIVDNVDFIRGIVSFRRKLLERIVAERQSRKLVIKMSKEALERYYRRRFDEGEINGKRFDLVSDDKKIIGEVIIARGKRPSSSYFEYIASSLWFLEKIDVSGEKFIVFCGDKKVPIEWLRRFGHKTRDIKFYFFNIDTSELIELNK